MPVCVTANKPTSPSPSMTVSATRWRRNRVMSLSSDGYRADDSWASAASGVKP
jgi:hypothetical protein